MRKNRREEVHWECVICGEPMSGWYTTPDPTHPKICGEWECKRDLYEERLQALYLLRQRHLGLGGSVLEVMVEEIHRGLATGCRRTLPKREHLGGSIHFGADGTPAGRSKNWRAWRDGLYDD